MAYKINRSIQLVYLVLFISCSLNTESSQVYEKLNEKGQIVERWGNYHQRDDNDNFRTYFFYDSLGRLVKEKMFILNPDNIACVLQDFNNYIETTYEYDMHGMLHFEKKFFPETDENGNVIGHELRYHYDHATDQTIVPNMEE